MEYLVQFSSLVGAILLLIGFALSSFKKINSASVTYHSINFCGASLLTLSAALSTNYGFFLLNFTWTIISSTVLIKAFINFIKK